MGSFSFKTFNVQFDVDVKLKTLKVILRVLHKYINDVVLCARRAENTQLSFDAIMMAEVMATQINY